MSNQQLATQQTEFKSYLNSQLAKFKNVLGDRKALPFLTECLNGLDDPALARCSHESMYQCLFKVATYGLSISGPVPQASLIPFGEEAVLVISYQGLKALARRDESVRDVRFESVRQGETYEYLGATKEPHHIEVRGRRKLPVTDAYCIVDFMDGRVLCRSWSVEECIDHRDQYSKGWQRVANKPQKAIKHPWHPENPSFDVMCGKTVFRYMVQRGDIPVSTAIRRELESEIDGEVVASNEETIVESAPMDLPAIEPPVAETDPGEIRSDFHQWMEMAIDRCKTPEDIDVAVQEFAQRWPDCNDAEDFVFSQAITDKREEIKGYVDRKEAIDSKREKKQRDLV